MIADELERAFCQLIVSLLKAAYPGSASGGTLADGGDTLIATICIGLDGTLMQDGQTEMSDDNDIPINAGTMFHVYRGAGSEVVQYPCAIVTTDQNLRYQQQLPSRRLAILVLLTTDWRRIRQDADSVVKAVSMLSPGDYIELPFRTLPKAEPS